MLYRHHDFNEKIRYALLDPDKEWPRRKQPPELLSGNERKRPVHLSPLSTPKKARSPNLNKNHLSPNKGILKKRPNNTLNNMPVMPICKIPVCQLHRWSNTTNQSDDCNKKGVIPSGARSSVSQCKSCGVVICLQCYEMYHTCDDLTAKIDTNCSFKYLY